MMHMPFHHGRTSYLNFSPYDMVRNTNVLVTSEWYASVASSQLLLAAKIWYCCCRAASECMVAVQLSNTDCPLAKPLSFPCTIFWSRQLQDWSPQPSITHLQLNHCCFLPNPSISSPSTAAAGGFLLALFSTSGHLFHVLGQLRHQFLRCSTSRNVSW